MEQEVNLAVAKGARGIVYFPQRPPPGFQYDAMSPELVARLTSINTRLAANPLPPTTPPAENEPTLQEVVNRIDTLGTKIDALTTRMDALANRRLRATLDLTPADPAQ
jgi:hypothetical protein